MAKKLSGLLTRRSRNTMQLPIMPPAASLNEQKDRETGTDTSLSSRFPAYSTVPTYRSRSIESIPENSVRFTGIEAEKWQTDSTSITRDDGKPQRAKQKLKRVGRQGRAGPGDPIEQFTRQQGRVSVCTNGLCPGL
jgi:hypothetical protein